jgi:micrococcal nuclease
MKKSGFITLISLFLLLVNLSFAQQKAGFLPISKLVDGDLFWVTNENGKAEKISLIGVNTPESKRTERTEIEYFGKEATAYVNGILEGTKVRLEYEVQHFDRFKLLLAYVYLEDGTFLNSHLVKAGFAQVATYPPTIKYVEVFEKLERQARSNRRGLWV